MQTIKIFPRLYAIASTGKVKQWKLSVVQDKDGAVFIRKAHGYVDGKTQIQLKEVKSGKNIGRANETTVVEQAIFVAESDFKKKKDKNYIDTIPNENTAKILLPQLANNWNKRKHGAKYPAYIQPKMNGVCSLNGERANGEVESTSRGGKQQLPLAHLVDAIRDLKLPFVSHGEVFSKTIHFQDIIAASKKINKDTPKLQLWVFDIIDPNNKDATFETRMSMMDRFLPVLHPLIVKVPTIMVHNEAEVDRWYNTFLEQGFEGLIFRNADGVYREGHRSKDLLKYKPVKDAEFQIIGGEKGTGTADGCCIFWCVTADGKKKFKATPRGSREQTREYYNNLDSIIGKMLTVEFEDYSKEGVPLKPIGIAIRDYE